MKVAALLALLRDADPDAEVVVTRSSGPIQGRISRAELVQPFLGGDRVELVLASDDPIGLDAGVPSTGQALRDRLAAGPPE